MASNEYQMMKDEYFRQNFNTRLKDPYSLEYEIWKGLYSQASGRDISKDEVTYDMAGYWMTEGRFKDPRILGAAGGHFPDTWKKPNHPTFSEESVYHGTPSPYGGKWVGGRWSRDKDRDVYIPSREMLQTTHDVREVYDYFNNVEKGVKLELPQDERWGG